MDDGIHMICMGGRIETAGATGVIGSRPIDSKSAALFPPPPSRAASCCQIDRGFERVDEQILSLDARIQRGA